MERDGGVPDLQGIQAASLGHGSEVEYRGSGRAPIIGITASLKQDAEPLAASPSGRFVRTNLEYVEGVAEAGGVPVVLPPVAGPGVARTLLDGIDGLLLSGGSDVSPRYYGEEAMPELGATVPQRDEFEMALLEHALRRRMPIFGICRGMQILNVALGGTLYQDLRTQVDREMLLDHCQQAPGWEPAHEIEVDKNSGIEELMGAARLEVNSYHHQAVKDLASGLVAAGRSPDGVIEAVEAVDMSRRWIVGVQWHAEAMRAVAPQHRLLFEAHVRATERRILQRAAA